MKFTIQNDWEYMTKNCWTFSILEIHYDTDMFWIVIFNIAFDWDWRK